MPRKATPKPASVAANAADASSDAIDLARSGDVRPLRLFVAALMIPALKGMSDRYLIDRAFKLADAFIESSGILDN